MDQDTLKILFEAEMEKQPTSQQLTSWHNQYGKLSCNQCRSLNVPCTPTQPLSTVACANCSMRKIFCSRSTHERHLHVRELLKIDQETIRHLSKVIFAERKQQQQQRIQSQSEHNPFPLSFQQPALPTHIDPHALVNPSSTTSPNIGTIPTVHLPLFLSQSQTQSPFPQQDPSSNSYPPPLAQSSSAALIEPKTPSISSIYNDLSTLASDLEHTKTQNEQQRTELEQLRSAYQNLQASYLTLQRDHSNIQQVYTNLQTTHSTLQKTHAGLQQFVEKMRREVPIRLQTMSMKNQMLENEKKQLHEWGQKAHESATAWKDQAERDSERVRLLEEQIGGLSGQVEELRAKGMGSSLESSESQADLARKTTSDSNSEDQLQRFRDARRESEEKYLRELAEFKTKLETKEGEILDQLNRSNKLVAERSKDYTTMKALFRSFASIKGEIAGIGRIGIDMRPIMRKCAECGKELEALAEKMRGDMLAALCVDNAPEAEGEKQGEAEDLSRWIQSAEEAAAELEAGNSPTYQREEQEMVMLDVIGTGRGLDGVYADVKDIDTYEDSSNSRTSRPAKRMRVESEPGSDDSEIEILSIIGVPS